MTVATVALCLGILLVAGAGIFVLLILGDLRALWTLRRLRPSPIGSRGRVAVEGTTEYGTAGRQIAPATGEDCTWYRLILLREPSRAFSHGDGPDHDVILESESPAWPALADRLTRIPVDPRLVSPRRALYDPIMTDPPAYVVTELEHSHAEPVPLPPIVPTDVIDGLRGSERLRLTEIRLPHGTEVFAVGRTTRRGLLPSRAGLTVFTTDDRATTIATRRSDIRVGGSAAVWLTLIGLVLAVPSAFYLLTLPG
ncbi:hypothetical protein [Actinoplanes sp. CA-252034]|uniref:hypothetical protein n=1 Tax=Actinoplanes sp. CA-252034 TaxID=3239906 RepID=UPI003D994C63